MNDAPLVEVRDLRVHFAAKPNAIRAVDGVDLDVPRGQIVALVGESGCGKSTLARTIMGLEAPTSGAIRYAGEPLLPLPAKTRKALSRKLQMVFQDPDASLNPRMTVLGAIGEPMDLHESLRGAERERRVCELMEQVGLDPTLRGRYPHELSGGQKQRVCVARALAVKPELLVCDEAVSALDVSVQAQILNLLSDLRQKLGLTYLFITHDLRVVRYLADSVSVMYLGQIVEQGSTERVFEDPRHPYTKGLLAAVPSTDPERRTVRVRVLGDVPSPARPPPGCRFHTRCPEVFVRCSRDAPPLYPVPAGESRCFLSDPNGSGKTA